jgi:hypothetical protein
MALALHDRLDGEGGSDQDKVEAVESEKSAASTLTHYLLNPYFLSR